MTRGLCYYYMLAILVLICSHVVDVIEKWRLGALGLEYQDAQGICNLYKVKYNETTQYGLNLYLAMILVCLDVKWVLRVELRSHCTEPDHVYRFVCTV